MEPRELIILLLRRSEISASGASLGDWPMADVFSQLVSHMFSPCCKGTFSPMSSPLG